MLSEDTLDKLLQPFIDRQEKLNQYVISTISKRILEIGKLTTSDVYNLQRLFKSGSDIKLINAEIAKVTNLQIKEVKSLIKEVAVNNYVYAKPMYDYRHKSFVPYKKNKDLQRVVESVSRQTAGTFKNLSQSTAFMMRDPKNRQHFIPTSISDTYQRVIDEAIQKVQAGVMDFDTAMKQTVKDLGNSGLRYVSYETESGRIYTQRLDTAVRRNLNDGIKAINQGVQDLIGEEVGADGKEISVHVNSAPDHEPVQGRQFTNEEYDKLQSDLPFESYKSKWQDSEQFASIERAIGTWNCRHFTYSIVLEFNRPQYTDKQLSDMIEQNKKGYTTPNGIHLTMYQCTQMQRKYELAVRKMKDVKLAAQEAGNTQLANEYNAKIKATVKEYEQFSKDCGLKSHRNRM